MRPRTNQKGRTTAMLGISARDGSTPPRLSQPLLLNRAQKSDKLQFVAGNRNRPFGRQRQTENFVGHSHAEAVHQNTFVQRFHA